MLDGMSQVPGVNFTKNYSPVVNGMMFHILLLMIIHFGFSAKIVDDKTALLQKGIQEKIILSVPKVCPT